jgi:hypothetical protein
VAVFSMPAMRLTCATAAEPAKKRARESGASSLRSFARVSRDIDRVNKAPSESTPLLYRDHLLTHIVYRHTPDRMGERRLDAYRPRWFQSASFVRSLPSLALPLTLDALVTWATIKQDLTSGRDPDYDSDEDSPWGYDLLRAYSSPANSTELTDQRLLVRRSIVTVPHPTTGVRGPPQSLKKDFDEWKRRQEAGPEQDDDVVYHGDDMEREKESDGEDD